MDRSQLHRLLPHQGPALWLDGLLDHDTHSITGLSAWSHLQQIGPEASPCLLFEAAAQLCAAHGALYGGDKSIVQAFVGKVSALMLRRTAPLRRGPLRIHARQEGESPAGAAYAFVIEGEDGPLLDGKLLLVLVHA